MVPSRAKRAVLILVVLLVSTGFSLLTYPVPAVVLTNTGKVAEGSLSGIAPVVRLSAPEEVTIVGPDAQFDVPLSSILQITLDFPRVVIETAERVLIGPFSAFRGIAEIVRLDRPGENSVTFPTASLRAIALNGHPLRPVPRAWLGDRYLSEPEIFAAAPFVDAECEDCTIVPPSRSEDEEPTPIWNLTPDYPVEEESSGLPWWVGLLGVAALFVLAYLFSTSGSST